MHNSCIFNSKFGIRADTAHPALGSLAAGLQSSSSGNVHLMAVARRDARSTVAWRLVVCGPIPYLV